VVGVLDGKYKGENISNAIVTLYDGKNTVKATFDSIKVLSNSTVGDGKLVYYTKNVYIIAIKKMAIVAGKTYTLTVNAPDYPTAEATCTVPFVAPDRKKIKAEITFEPDRNNRLIPNAVVKFDDIATMENNYSVGIFFTEKYILDSGVSRENGRGYAEYFTDYLQDGQTLISSKYAFANYTTPAANLPTIERRFNIFVANTDKPYYLFNRALQQLQTNDDNPFAESILTYTNIKNGLGIFAAYNTAQIEVLLK
jgi:hypothetical protein